LFSPNNLTRRSLFRLLLETRRNHNQHCGLVEIENPKNPVKHFDS
jgi:hypothetical protein